MRENKSHLTVSQALKFYTGTGLAGTILGLAAYEVIFFAGAYAMMTLVIALSEGISLSNAVSNIAEAPAGDCVMAFAPALINYRSAPGGKLFRTVKGGFDTFARERVGIYISTVLAALIFCIFAFLLDLIGIAKTQNGLSAVIAVFVSSLMSLGAGTFALLIPGDALRGFASVLISFVTGAGVAIVLNILRTLNGSLLPHIIAGIVGAALMIISAKVYLSYYKKNLWNS